MKTNAIMVNGEPVDYSGLPEHMQQAMEYYIEHGIEPGSFLMAVLSNDFMGAVGKADHINQARLVDYAKWLYNCAPPACFGSKDKVRGWIAWRSNPLAILREPA